MRSVSNSQLGEALDGSDSDEDVTDNVFIAPGDEEKKDQEK